MRPANDRPKLSRKERERRALPFFIEFVKFSTGFAVIIACALVTLHFASTL